jgi:hAT family C-terminal dimerisation region
MMNFPMLSSQQSSAMDLAKLLIIENSGVASCVPDVCTAFIIFLTLPVTLAGAERSYSKLKLIKNYLRSSMSESRLSGLALLSIEGERTRQLDVDAVIDRFADANVRRKVRFARC